MKSIVLSSVSEFSITDVPSKDTRSDRKLSDSTTSSLSSLQKCETQFSYLEDAASGHERDNNGTFLPMKQIFTNLLYKSPLVILGCVHQKGNGALEMGLIFHFVEVRPCVIRVYMKWICGSEALKPHMKI